MGDLPCGFAEFAPDLVVDVLSPEERESVWLDKVSEYLQAGVRLVYVLDPERRWATTYRTWTDVPYTESDGQLEGGDVLPGFTSAPADVFVWSPLAPVTKNTAAGLARASHRESSNVDVSGPRQRFRSTRARSAAARVRPRAGAAQATRRRQLRRTCRYSRLGA